jgi:hypothetical protein
MKIKNWDKIKEGTLLLVTWDDIVSNAAWLKDDEAQNIQPEVCKDVGWFINDDELNIRISSSINSGGEKSATVIPKGVIRDVKKINYKRG